MSQCLAFISEYWTANNYAPSYEDIKTALGARSKASVADLVARLEKRGYIERTPNLARSIRVLPAAVPPTPPGKV